VKNYFKRGEPMVLVSGATLAVILFMTLTLMAVILGNSLGYFWVKGLVRLQLSDGSLVMGQLTDTERHALTDAERLQLKVGNRDLYAQDFRWVDHSEVSGQDIPADAYLLERHEHGNFFGFLKELKDIAGAPVAADHASLLRLHREVLKQKDGLATIKREMSRLNQASERLRLKILKLEYRDAVANGATIARLTEQRDQLTVRFDELLEQLNQRQAVINQASAVFSDAGGTDKELALQELVRIYQPNRMSVVAKAGAYLVKIKELLLDAPRESNTEGGLFPAIFGTVMVLFYFGLALFILTSDLIPIDKAVRIVLSVPLFIYALYRLFVSYEKIRESFFSKEEDEK
jgi:phosphate transport system permease protein